MKKTLIALMALASVAAAEDYTGTFSWGVDAEALFNTTDAITLTNLTVDKAYKATNYNPGTFTPSVNMNAGSWTASFTLTNTSSEAITLSSVTFDAFIFNGGGNQHTTDTVTREVKFTLSGALVGETTVNYTTPWNTDADANITFATPVELAAGAAYNVTLKVENGGTNPGSFVGLKGATFTSVPVTDPVPEPTTATLSLLALAGLAARRRRK